MKVWQRAHPPRVSTQSTGQTIALPVPIHSFPPGARGRRRPLSLSPTLLRLINKKEKKKKKKKPEEMRASWPNDQKSTILSRCLQNRTVKVFVSVLDGFALFHGYL